MAGLAAARGRAVIMMDADLQHPPSLVPQLVRKWREGFQIVHAVRRDPPNVVVVQAHDVEALLPVVRVHERRRDRARLRGFPSARSAGRRRGSQVRRGRAVPARARALGRLCDGERAVRLRRAARGNEQVQLAQDADARLARRQLVLARAAAYRHCDRAAVVDVGVPRHGLCDRRLVGRRRRRAGLGIVRRDHLRSCSACCSCFSPCLPSTSGVSPSRCAAGRGSSCARRRGRRSRPPIGARNGAGADGARKVERQRVPVSVCGIRLRASSSSAASTSS